MKTRVEVGVLAARKRGGKDRACIYVVISGVHFMTEVDDMARAMLVAARVAKALGVEVEGAP